MPMKKGIMGPKILFASMPLTLGALLILTCITVVVAQFDLGEANVFAAIGVATLKALLSHYFSCTFFTISR